MNTAIIVAAGSGQRFAGSQPKQFVNLLGKPLIVHTLEKFDACPEIGGIVLVLSDDGREWFERIKDQFEISNLKSVIGGRTRAESVRNGIDSLDAEDDDIMVIHDGARPLVAVDEISRTVLKAQQTGAACLVTDVTETIKEIDGEHILRTIDRGKLRRALTPQAFRYDILQRAFEGIDLTDSITDECYLVEELGVKISIVEGSARNIKITRPADILLAAAILSEPPA